MSLESELYARLKELRQQLAVEKKLPAYCIFSNKALEEMAAVMPTSREEFASIYGVGTTKLRQYGEKFLSEILRFREENDIATPASLTPPKGRNGRARAAVKTSALELAVHYPEQKAEAITIENFEEVKASLQQILASYDQVLYTPDQLRQAKQDKATLNKLKRAIAVRRKEIKDICLEPYYNVEAQLKELLQMIDIPLEKISEFTAEMTQVQRDTKSATVKLFFDQEATILGAAADRVFSSVWFYNKKWENKSTPEWVWQNEIRQKIENVAHVFRELTEKAGNNAPAVIAKFIETGRKDQALELLNTISSLGEDIDVGGQKPTDAVSTRLLEVSSQCEEPPQQTSEMIIKITGTSAQNQAVLHYLKELGVKFEVFVSGE